MGGGDAHFDADEKWSEVRDIHDEHTSLFAVAVHEFGHSLGLSHSSHKESLMYPWYTSVPQNFDLPPDDLQAIQHLYGASGERQPRPRERPRPEETPSSPEPRPTS